MNPMLNRGSFASNEYMGFGYCNRVFIVYYFGVVFISTFPYTLHNFYVF